MKIDRNRVQKVFMDYVEAYDRTDERIRLKVEHTKKVAAVSEQIAKNLHLPKEEQDLAWLIGMLHDIGRFEQLRQYHTFVDADSLDHAALGVEILFGTAGEIRKYVEEDTEDPVIFQAVKNHSLYRIQEQKDSRTEMFCHIIRDADKIDIFRVNVEFSYETLCNADEESVENCEVSSETMQAFMEHHAVLRKFKKTPADHAVAHLALVFELVYPVSLKIAIEQGNIEKMMHYKTKNPVTQKQFQRITGEMEAYLQEKRAD